MATFGISGGAKKEKTTNNPWGVQIPYLQSGFEQAQANLTASQQSQYGNILGQYGSQLAPSIGQAQNFYSGVMSGGANPYTSDQYNQIRGDYWQPQHQQMADDIRSQTVEGLRRSDWGDAMGASMSGMGVGIDSSPYVKARLAQSEQATQGYQSQLAGLHMGAAGDATNLANQWAGSQFGAADQMQQLGMAGLGMMGQQHNLPWQDLQNYWNIIGSKSWGGTSTKKSKELSGGIGF